MKLIDYIKGTRRGREANAIEREAMGDPFLSDAIEGYDSVYGNHSDTLAELEEKIVKRAARKRKVRPVVVPLHASGEDIADNVGIAGNRGVAVESCNVVDNGIADEVRRKRRRSRLSLMFSAAAVLLLCVAGLLKYFSGERSTEDDVRQLIAMEMNDISMPDTVSQELLAHTPEMTESDSKAVLAQEEVVAVQEEIVPTQEEARQFIAPQVLMSDEEVLLPEGQTDVAQQKLQSGISSDSFAEEEVHGVDIADLAEHSVANEEISADLADIEAHEESIVMGYGTAKTADKTLDTDNSIDTVVNEEFMAYFRENSKLQVNADGERTTGEVVVEFRVNDRGVPSAIRIISGISVESNHEVIDFLTKGPKWTPTHGQRVRMVIEYK